MQLEKISGVIIRASNLKHNSAIVIDFDLKENNNNNTNFWSVSISKPYLIDFYIKNKNKLNIGTKIIIKGRAVRLSKKYNYIQADKLIIR
jgi:hypothetical protein